MTAALVALAAIALVLVGHVAYRLGRLAGIRFVKDELAEARRNARWLVNR